MADGLSVAECNLYVDASIAKGTWIKLHIGDPGAAGTGNAAGNTTRRQATYAAATGGTATSSADTDWTSVSTAETYTHFSRWTASTAGTFLGKGALTASKTVAVGDNVKIPSGSLTCTITPAS